MLYSSWEDREFVCRAIRGGAHHQNMEHETLLAKVEGGWREVSDGWINSCLPHHFPHHHIEILPTRSPAVWIWPEARVSLIPLFEQTVKANLELSFLYYFLLILTYNIFATKMKAVHSYRNRI